MINAIIWWIGVAACVVLSLGVLLVLFALAISIVDEIKGRGRWGSKP